LPRGRNGYQHVDHQPPGRSGPADEVNIEMAPRIRDEGNDAPRATETKPVDSTTAPDDVTLVEERVLVDERPVAPPAPLDPLSDRGEVNVVSEDELVEVLPDGAVRRRVDRVEHRRGTGRWLAPALLAVLLLAGIAIAAAWYFARDTTKAVPTVVGLSIDAAVARLDAEGFDADITSIERSGVDPGVVFRQQPQGGVDADGGSTVQVFASLGDAAETVPSVASLNLATARARLEAAGFDVSVTRTASAQPRGTVLTQAPAGGGRLSTGGVVALTVSSGRATVTVPNAVGLSETEGRDRLTSANFPHTVQRVFSERPEGEVVSQSPAAGTAAQAGQSIVLRVSKGSASVAVPSVVGLTQEDATQQVEAAGLAIDLARVPSADPEGTVVAQFPTGGQTANRGSSVRLNISTGVPS
jgi:beta-lactam-binding protein with PASTA domain